MLLEVVRVEGKNLGFIGRGGCVECDLVWAVVIFGVGEFLIFFLN